MGLKFTEEAPVVAHTCQTKHLKKHIKRNKTKGLEVLAKDRAFYIHSCGLSLVGMQQEDVSMIGIVESHSQNNWERIKIKKKKHI